MDGGWETCGEYGKRPLPGRITVHVSFRSLYDRSGDLALALALALLLL